MTGCDVAKMWPELFHDVTAEVTEAIRQAFASQYLSGWEPNRPDVHDFVEYHHGRLTEAEYMQRGLDRASAVTE